MHENPVLVGLMRFQRRTQGRNTTLSHHLETSPTTAIDALANLPAAPLASGVQDTESKVMHLFLRLARAPSPGSAGALVGESHFLHVLAHLFFTHLIRPSELLNSFLLTFSSHISSVHLICLTHSYSPFLHTSNVKLKATSSVAVGQWPSLAGLKVQVDMF